MSLVGSLEDLSLLDILQIVNVSRRTGRLRLSTPDMGISHIYFSGGSVADIVGAFSEERFLAFFEAQGIVDPRELQDARGRAGDDVGAILNRLVDTGTLNRRLVEQARRMELSRRLKSLTQQTRGEFSFSLADEEEDSADSAAKAFWLLDQPVSPQNLLTEGLSEGSFSEWIPAAQASVPSPKPAPAPRPSPPPPPAPGPPEPAVPDLPPPESRRAEELFRPSPETPAGALPPPSAPVLPAPDAKASRPASLHPARSKVTVLLASDESIFKSLLRQRLLKHFADVRPVTSLEEYEEACRACLQQHLPFLALVDLLMPTRDGRGYLGGLELLEASTTDFPEVKVMLMTDLSDERILDMARAKGAVAILLKPALSQLRIDQFEESIDAFSQGLTAEVDRLVPPVEEEVATFFRDLGAESVSEGYRVRDQLALLKGLMGELATPRESSEISLLVLRLASEYFERAILFLVKKDEIVGLGGFGDTGDREMMMQKVRRLRIPVGAGSLFDEPIRERTTLLKAKKDFAQVDKDFLQAIGSKAPKEIVAIPMISRGRVVAILFADNAISGEDLPDLSGIEIFMAQAGLAMEKALLERQLMSLKRSIPPQLGGGRDE